MATTTLSEFYSSQGKALPSVKDRGGVAAQAGIQGYTGTAAQNAQLLGFLSSNQGGSTPSTTGTPNIPTIPAQNVNSGTQPLPLPEKPQSQAPTDIYTSSVAYLNTIPKTGVKGLDEITTAMVERPGQLNQQFGLEEKRALAESTKNTLDAFNEEYRVKAEQLRVDNSKTAASKQISIEELERNRAFKAGSLAIEAAFRNNDFVGAQTLMNQQLQLELEPLKMRYKFFEDMYNRTEDQKFQRAMKAEDRAYQAAREDLGMINDIKMQAFKDGKIAIGDIAKIKTWEDLALYTGTTKTDALEEFEAANKVATVDELIAGKGKGQAVGARLGARGVSEDGQTIFGSLSQGKRKTFVAKTEQLLEGLTLDKLQQAKARGITFGSLTEGERNAVANAATFIGQTRVRDGGKTDGKVLGYDIPEKDFNEAMQTIREAAILDYERRTGKPYTGNPETATPEDYLMQAPAGNPAISNEQFF